MTDQPTRKTVSEAGFKIYHELMAFKVREILLVHTAYDAFIMEGDGTLASRIVTQYHGLNLSHPPRLTLAVSGDEALELLLDRRFDLAITMPQIGEMDAFALAARLKKAQADLPLVLVSHSFAPHLEEKYLRSKLFDDYYVWSSDPDLLLAVIKNVEDHRNAPQDTALASVRILLLVEDSPLYRSFFLPLLYKEVVRQTQSVLDEGLNEEHRLLQMRARPKILIAANYEKALELYRRFKPFVFGVIADTRFPKSGRLREEAGVELLTGIRREIADLPLLLLSAESANRSKAEAIPAIFIDKNSPDLAGHLHAFFLEHLGFGDFVFRDEKGRELARAVNLIDFERKIKTVDEKSLLYHAGRNHFSNWIMARSEVSLAGLCSRETLQKFEQAEPLRAYLAGLIREELIQRQRGIVSQFSERDFDAEIMEFVKCGKGALGGKAQGLAFLSNYLRRTGALDDTEGVRIAIPRTFVITTEGFDAFMAENCLAELHRQHLSDEAITAIFVQAPLPGWLRRALAMLLEQIDHPIIVRSSSVLEDAHFAPYAGLFVTCLLANNAAEPQTRQAELEEAVKKVYASALHAGPRSFAKGRRQHRPGSMAVMVQQLAGHRYSSFFYPAVSGVAQSRNFYPLAPMQAEEGIAHIALGLGKTVVEGEKSLSFSPAHPSLLPQFTTVEDILDNSQKSFYALELEGDGATGRLVTRRLLDAAAELPVRRFCGSYSADDHRVRDSYGSGIPVLTFAEILKHRLIPLPGILRELLELARQGTGGEVEIEFSLDLNDGSSPPTFFILQLRPLTVIAAWKEIAITAADRKKALLYATETLGHGRLETIRDILYVKGQNLSAADSRAVAGEISLLNARLSREGRPYLLIGPGRWGSADPLLGIPVRWQDINDVQAMVEIRDENLPVEPSQGTHFFQNIIASGIHYLGVDRRGKGRLDDARLDQLPAASESGRLNHIRLPKPLVVKTDSKSGQCVILLPEK